MLLEDMKIRFADLAEFRVPSWVLKPFSSEHTKYKHRSWTSKPVYWFSKRRRIQSELESGDRQCFL